jgi:hypothetical protein
MSNVEIVGQTKLAQPTKTISLKLLKPLQIFIAKQENKHVRFNW